MKFETFGLNEESIETSAEVLGGKGAGLVWMHQNGVPVPPGFIIPTSVWAEYDKNPTKTMQSIAKELPAYLKKLEAKFGYMPLVSARSGARVSLPGMMDTILNIGLDSSTADFWKKKLGDDCFFDSFHRLVIMYGSVVDGADRELLTSAQAPLDAYTVFTGKQFPNAFNQLLGAIEAVFKSWDSERALIYRKLESIPREWGTAVTVQAMVFGNLNDQSGTGVLFTRNPDTGENVITGEYLVNAQGEDVVAGIRTPMPLAHMPNTDLYYHLLDVVRKLEKAKQNMQDVEFTIQDNKLFLLQTRNGKRSSQAAVRIAVEMEKEKLMSAEAAIKSITPKMLDLAKIPTIDPKFKTPPMYKGIAACSGVVTGKPVFSSAAAIKSKVPCILITKETTPDDLGGMLAAKGVITMEGGLTSHAAVVARGQNKPCITGVGEDLETIKTHGGVVSMDGSTGYIWLEKVPVIEGQNKYVDLYEDLVMKTLGAVPVLTAPPTRDLEEAVLYLGCEVLDTAKAFNLVTDTAKRVKRLYVDLYPSTAAEQNFMKNFATYHADQLLVNELEAYKKMAPKANDLNLVLITAAQVTKFETLGVANDLRSVIMAKTELAFDSNFTTDDPALDWVLQHKKQEGLKFVSLGNFQVGAKSLISLQQGMQVGGV